jgi:hypothetical protein
MVSLSRKEVEILPTGDYRVTATGEVFLRANVRKSLDGFYHRCTLDADKKGSTLLRGLPQQPCFFAPPDGF